MNRVNRKIVLATLVSVIAPMALAQDHTPSGTITLSGGAVAVGIGYTWGNGVLDFKGKKYAFTVDGLSVVDVGVANIEGAGEVYNLRDIQQFAGNYVAAGVGATIAGGASVVAMENQNGVVIHLHSTQQGLKLNLSASGMSVHLK